MKTPRLPTSDLRQPTSDLRPSTSDLRFLLAALIAGTLGCSSPKPPAPEPVPPPPNAPEVAEAEKLFESGHLQDSIVACIDISKKNPEARGLVELQKRITDKLADDRMADAEKRASAADRLHVADAKGFDVSPETYQQKKHVVGETSSLKKIPTTMEQALHEPIDLTLENADVNAIIAEIKKSTNINYIADSDIVSTKKITARFENTPLIEMLDYFDKNLDISFSVYSNLIWITQKEAPATGSAPMKTRVYRLRKGLVGSELGKTARGVTLFLPLNVDERGGRNEAGKVGESAISENLRGKGDLLESVLRENPADGSRYALQPRQAVGLLEAISRFVPQPEGSDFYFNEKVNTLFVKNTPENLAVVEDLIDAMDVRPLQILIEARFITTTINDLRDLGVDWLIDNRGSSQFTTGFSSDGGWVKGNTKGDPARRDVLTGSFAGVSDTGTGGGKLAYQFLLGDTALQATLHALESTGKSRTIVVPRVTTRNNHEAVFRVGEDTSFFEQVDTSIMTSGSTYGNSESRDNVTYDYDQPTIVQTGYSLLVTPSVGSDLSTISLVLRPEISTVKKWEEYALSSLASTDPDKKEPTLKIPTISRQYIETEAVVRSGETVVLGGLVDTLKSDDSSGTPWFSKLPWIGYLFKTEKTNDNAKNVLIFVTATLISDVGEELIPLNAQERYGLSVPDSAKVPDILKVAPAAASAPAAAAAPAAVPSPAVEAAAAKVAPAP